MIKRLKDYIIDANSSEGNRPLGGAVGLLRHNLLFYIQRSKTTNLNKEIPDLDWLLFSLLFLKFWELKNGGALANRNAAAPRGFAAVIPPCFPEFLLNTAGVKSKAQHGQQTCPAEVSLSTAGALLLGGFCHVNVPAGPLTSHPV